MGSAWLCSDPDRTCDHLPQKDAYTDTDTVDPGDADTHTDGNAYTDTDTYTYADTDGNADAYTMDADTDSAADGSGTDDDLAVWYGPGFDRIGSPSPIW